MTIHVRTTISPLVALFILCAPAVLGQKIMIGEWKHPKVKARELAIKRLVVLPSEFTLTKDTMKGKQSLETENLRFSPIIDHALMTALKNTGVGISESSPSPEALANSPDLRSAVGGVQQDFDAISELLFKKPKDLKKGRFKVNEETLSALQLKEAAQSDAVLFVRGFGGRVTRAKAFAKGGGLLGAARAGGLHINVVLSFVDPVNGDVLFVKGLIINVKDENTEERMVRDFGRWLKSDRKKVFTSI